MENGKNSWKKFVKFFEKLRKFLREKFFLEKKNQNVEKIIKKNTSKKLLRKIYRKNCKKFTKNKQKVLKYREKMFRKPQKNGE